MSTVPATATAPPLALPPIGARDDLAERSVLSPFIADSLDRATQAALARATGGLAPGVILTA